MAINNVDWNRYAEQYDNVTCSGINPAYSQLQQRVFDYFDKLQLEGVSLFADLGGGTGNFSLDLAQKYPDTKFVIIDTSKKMLEIAGQKAKQRKLTNVDTIVTDCESLDEVCNEYHQPFDHAIMIHALYTTRSQEDPEKPKRILSKVCYNLKDDSSRFVISDINRKLKTGSWIPYCLWHGYKKLGSLKKTLDFYKENDQSKKANRFIDAMQDEGNFLLCSLDEMESMLKHSGFNHIYKKTDKVYRGRDNYFIVGK